MAVQSQQIIPSMTDKKTVAEASQGAVAISEANNSNISITNVFNLLQDKGLTKAEIKQLEQRYLERLVGDCASLEWLSLMGKVDNESNNPSLKLDAIYTALLTQSLELEGEKIEQREQKKLSAVAMLDKEQYLVLTGDPGSGKSAFVNYLAICLAGEVLENPQANLQCLTAPLPDRYGNPESEEIEKEIEQEVREPETREIRQPWQHGALIPIRFILRDFSASVQFPDNSIEANTCHLINFLENQLQQQKLEACFNVLEARLQSGEALVMFDGLDEVPQAGERRQHLLACIESFVKTYPHCRVLVTCRPYAYQEKQWQLHDFTSTTLVPFHRGQIIRFIQSWYTHLPAFEPEVAKQRAQKLQHAVLSRPALEELAQRPLLLSLIAYLHANRHDLPERRAELYKKLLSLLVDKWERARFKVADCDEAFKLDQHSLAEYLQVNQSDIHLVLQRLAFRAHALQDAQHSGTADIASKDLTHELAYINPNKQADISQLNEYLCDRVGILYQRGGSNNRNAVYTFPHRSFQEYLAAAYFGKEEDELFEFFEAKGMVLEDDATWQSLIAQLVTTDPDRWREVTVLAAGMCAKNEPSAVWDLIEELYALVDDNSLGKQAAWSLRLASEILVESLNIDSTHKQVRRRGKRVFSSLIDSIVLALGTSHLPAVERVAMGRYLSELGDPRPEVNNVDDMLFCFIPKGKFWMGKGEYDQKYEELGSETPAGEYLVGYDYYMAQNPVTLAQFRTFIEETDFELGNNNALSGKENAPIVEVSQTEALVFCDWLTKRWQQQGIIDKAWQVTLPNEPEWEKAARGDLNIPKKPLVSSIKSLKNSKASKENNEIQRRYPWGNDISFENVNYEFKAGSTNTSSIYPLGESPYGCEDMSGNVWEWTRSCYGNFPYPEIGSLEWQARESTQTQCGDVVLRGGAFNFDSRNVRCSIRIYATQDLRISTFGLRLILSLLL